MTLLLYTKVVCVGESKKIRGKSPSPTNEQLVFLFLIVV